jgi:preprotein translocase subunit SecG
MPGIGALGGSLSQQLYNQQTPHHIPALMWLSIVIPILLSILAIVCVLLTLVVLMQRPKNEGLGAAFGSGVTENIFGAQTATVLTKTTVYLGCIFFGITLLLTVLTARQSMDRRVGVLESEVRKAAASPTRRSPRATAAPQHHPQRRPPCSSAFSVSGGSAPRVLGSGPSRICRSIPERDRIHACSASIKQPSASHHHGLVSLSPNNRHSGSDNMLDSHPRWRAGNW